MEDKEPEQVEDKNPVATAVDLFKKMKVSAGASGP
jgi:hypothetical protein